MKWGFHVHSIINDLSILKKKLIIYLKRFNIHNVHFKKRSFYYFGSSNNNKQILLYSYLYAVIFQTIKTIFENLYMYSLIFVLFF